jgi:predicted N-formylglutamate amidohydrolase
MSLKLVISAEHYSNQVPEGLEAFFAKDKGILDTHRGYDIGSSELYRVLAPLADHSRHGDWSRLVIELNRSLHHKALFSSFMDTMSEAQKQEVLAYYNEYRTSLNEAMRKYLVKGHQVLHLSLHTFTPELNGTVRNADVGLLYDPARTREKAFSSLWKQVLKESGNDLRVRFNYPYLGKADGFTTALRKAFGTNYIGIELEVNQAFFKEDIPHELLEVIKKSFKKSLTKFQ